jgi:hypothetical protein
MQTLKKKKTVSIMNARIVTEELLECRHKMVAYVSSDVDYITITCDMCHSIREDINAPSLLSGSSS